MSRSNGRKRHRGGAAEHENDERWLLTYADMITLLMALFMVLFSISAVNVSKYRTLQEALRAAFSGDILPGGRAIEQPGTTANSSHTPATANLQAVVPLTNQGSTSLENAASSAQTSAQAASAQSSAHTAAQAAAVAKAQAVAAQQEQNEFQQIQKEIEAYAARHGFAKDVHTAIEQRGLVIRVLTDSLLFPSGSATLDPQGLPLLAEIASLLNVDAIHPIAVEGNTDNVPIHSSLFPSNWELSTARASMVVRFLISKGVTPQRLSAAGYADLRPIASNATAQGRALNRRVEIVLQRLH
jgi:chemotaxis protein MotB